MALFMKTQSKRRMSFGVAAGAILVATVALGSFSGTANADSERGERGWEHREYRHHTWNGGYYRRPPVVYYNSPGYYYPPPVVYGPGFGLNFNIR